MTKKKVLLAEDDIDDREVFVFFLNEKIDIAACLENGIHVIELLNATTNADDLPDIIILDHNMPLMNGKDTLAALKQNTRYAQIPVFIYSTYADKNLIENYKSSGALLVYDKPTTQKGYEQMIDTFLAHIN